MDSALVIKVQYKDTLRRFTAHVNQNNGLDLDMAGFRAKVLSLFNLAVDKKLVLKYVDEDGDLVTLVDDADLHDMTKQRLKFIRVYVSINKGKEAKSKVKASGGSSPSGSTPAPNPSTGTKVVIDPETLPEPLREAMSKLTTDLSKLTTDFLSSSPAVTNIADSISRIVLPVLGTYGQAHAAAGPSSEKGVSEKPLSSKAPKFTRVNSAPIPGHQVEAENVPRVSPVVIASDAMKNVPESLHESVSNLVASISNMGLSNLNPHHVEAGSCLKTGACKESASSEARGPQPTHADSTSNSGHPVKAVNVDFVANVESVDLIRPSNPFSCQSTNVNTAPLSPGVPDRDGKKGKKCTDGSLANQGEISGTFPTFTPLDRSYACYYGQDIGKDFLPNFKRSSNYPEPSGLFHKGVRCDGCGIYPITGPRFKSQVRENYDLCSICFNKMGNESDYHRMDFPLHAAQVRRSPKGVYDHVPMGPPILPHVFKAGSILRHAKPKLDSRFVLDVNVIDGTMMAPSTAFTKIWRMRNNGTVVWPKGTQLVWIGGDKFSDSHSVQLELPEDGIPVEKELDVAVDFRAPDFPGRYVSYWKMASSSGHLFGQRVWVLIQVDASLKDPFYVSFQGLNLNIPLDVGSSTGPQIIDINAQPIEDDFGQSPKLGAPTAPASQMAAKQPMKEPENGFPVDEAKYDVPAATPTKSATPSSVSYPMIDLSETAPAVPLAPAVSSGQQFLAVDAKSSSLGTVGKNSVEESLLKELEEMGFMQIDLNKEILRKNEFNLEQSVDDLCGVYEWDPILEELQEMGFRDNETNKRLLKKNNGSIKRVVMDLINGEE